MNWLPMEQWSPYAVGIGIGLLSWVRFLLSDEGLACSSVYPLGRDDRAAFTWEEGQDNPCYLKFAPEIDWGWMLVLGVLIGAFIRTYKFHVRLRKRLPLFGSWAVVVATLVAVISPLCACGVLPIMVSLVTSGVPLAPAMALLVASPLMSFEGYAVTAGLLGPTWANAKVVAAVFMGLWAGLVTHFVSRRGFSTAELFRGKIPEGDMHDPDCDHRIACNCPDRWSNRVGRRYPNKFVIF